MRIAFICCAILLGGVSASLASNVGVSVNIGVPAVSPPVVIDRPPVFLMPPKLGFYVAAGVGYDMFYLGNRYYLNKGNIWYSSPYYNGPWVNVRYNSIPHQIRRYPISRIHQFRDNHYRQYTHGRDRYRHKHFQPAYRDYRPARDDRGRHRGPGAPGHGRPDHGGGHRGHGGGPR